MPTTWTIAIDWDRNDNYSGTYDDVTNRVISAKWFLGMCQAYKEDADNSTLELVLSNVDKLLSPENSSSPLWDGSATPPRSKVQPFRTVRIQDNAPKTWLTMSESK